MGREPLTSKELRQLSVAVGAFYSASNVRSLLQVAVDTLGAFVASDSVHVIADVQRDCNFMATSNSQLEALFKNSLPALIHYHQLHPHISSKVFDLSEAGRVHRLSDYFPHSFAKEAGYDEIFSKPNFCENQLYYAFAGVQIPPTLACGRNGKEFSSKEKAIFQFLAPHLQQAYQNTLILERNRQRLQMALGSLSVVGHEMIWIHDDGRVQESSSGAYALLKDFFPHPAQINGFPEAVYDWAKSCVKQSSVFRNRNADALECPLLPLTVRKPQATLVLRFFYRRTEDMHLIILERKRHDISIEDLRPFGLSNREGEVLIWVCHGKTNLEIAAILGISRRTIDWHVQSILSRLGVENRLAATLLVKDFIK